MEDLKTEPRYSFEGPEHSSEPELPLPSLPYEEFCNSPEEFFEFVSTLTKGEHETFGATPLNRRKTLEEQINLEISLRRRTYEVPSGVSIVIANYIQRMFAERFHRRAEANEENYHTSLSDGSEYEHIEGITEMYHRGELGEATPAELLMMRKMKQIRSVELACLTHPYGNEIDMLKPMRETVRASVEHLGGLYVENPKERFSVKDVIKDVESGDVLGYLMTRKKVLGFMPDGTEIRERSSFVLQINSPAVIEMLGEDMRSGLNEFDSVARVLKLEEISQALLKYDQFSAAIPISSTIYAFNREDAALIKEKADLEKSADLKVFARHYPLLYAISQGDLSPLEQKDMSLPDRIKRRLKVLPTVMANRLKNLF